MDVPSAELFLGDVVAHRVADDRRAGHKQLRDVTHHHREMAEHRLRRADADHAAEQHIDDRNLGELRDVHRAAEMAGQKRAAFARHARPPGGDGAGAFLRVCSRPPSAAWAPSRRCCRRPRSRRADESRGSEGRVTAGQDETLFPPIAPSACPPREVKSSAHTTAVRPAILPHPPTWLAGVKPATRPSSS